MNQDENFDQFLIDRKKITRMVVAASIGIIVVVFCIVALFVTRSLTTETIVEEKNNELVQVEQIDPSSEFVAGITNTSTQIIEETPNELENIVNTNTIANNMLVNNTVDSSIINIVPEEGYTTVNETVYATTTVHIRKGPSTESETLGSLFTEQSVQRIGIGANGWSKVIYRNSEAYVYSEYLTTEAPPERPKLNVTVRGNSTVDPEKPMVCLTFDDGPNPVSTNRILDVLEQYNVKATFFDLGNLMAAYPDTVKREEDIGCEVASHTYSHKNLNKLTYDEIQNEQDKTEEQMQKILGHTSNLIRPPYGNANNTVRDALYTYGLIGWDIDTLDWKSKDADAVISEVRKYSDYDGRIILMHSIYNSTAEAVETIVPELLNKGYQLVTVSEMIKYKNANVESGKLYYNFRNE